MQKTICAVLAALCLGLAGCLPIFGGAATPTLAPTEGLPTEVATATTAATATAVATATSAATATTAATATEVATATPVATATTAATATPVATATEVATATLTVTTAPTSTATPALSGPPEAIAIVQPGPGSRVTSPLRVTGAADPTFEQALLVRILLADGTLLASAPAQIGADVGQRGPFSVDVPFSIAAEQPGFVEVSSISAKDGKVLHLSSAVVTLLPAGGVAQINNAPETAERIRIDAPVLGGRYTGGVLHVEGVGLASFEQTLVIDLLDENGLVIATMPVTVAAPDLGQPGSFRADLPYSVARDTAARLQVRDVSPAHGGDSHISSVEILLLR